MLTIYYKKILLFKYLFIMLSINSYNILLKNKH